MSNHSTNYVDNNQDVEVWKDVVGYEGRYQVSNFGRVKSLDMILLHNYGGTQKRGGKILTLYSNKRNGYVYVCLCLSEQKRRERQVRVAGMVLEAFVGIRPEGMQTCHNDGDKQNNKLENLRWDTAKNNQKDRIKHGTDCRGENNSISKLTNKEVIEIRQMYATGKHRQSELARMFGITPTLVCSIVKRKT